MGVCPPVSCCFGLLEFLVAFPVTVAARAFFERNFLPLFSSEHLCQSGKFKEKCVLGKHDVVTEWMPAYLGL